MQAPRRSGVSLSPGSLAAFAHRRNQCGSLEYQLQNKPVSVAGGTHEGNTTPGNY
jgi:hypothetical protein